MSDVDLLPNMVDLTQPQVATVPKFSNIGHSGPASRFQSPCTNPKLNLNHVLFSEV